MALVISKLLSGRFSLASGVRAPLALVVIVVITINNKSHKYYLALTLQQQVHNKF